MRKPWKILLLIWDILLIPVIVTVLLSLSGIAKAEGLPLVFAFAFSIGLFLTYLYAGFSSILIPQVISLVLVTLSWAMPFRFWESAPTKKEIIHLVLLSIVAFLGAVCAYLALALMTRGEMGAPLP